MCHCADDYLQDSDVDVPFELHILDPGAISKVLVRSQTILQE